MILIVHNYAQVFDVCDRVNLLRNGRIECRQAVAETSVEELTSLVSRSTARETGTARARSAGAVLQASSYSLARCVLTPAPSS